MAAALTLLALGALPAYAWNSTPGPTTPSGTSIALGGSITDNAPLTLTANGPGTSPSVCVPSSTFGCIIFKVFAGTCSSFSTTTTYFTSIVAVTTASQGASHTYTSAAFTPLAAGNYVWVDTYSGTTGTNPYPTASFGCEPFTVNAPHGAPEFPAGLGILMALALPAMMLLKRRLPTQ